MKSIGWLTALLIAALLAAGCGPVPAHWRGELAKRDIYLHLMTPVQAAQFKVLESEEKDEQTLLLYCQEIGVYQKWQAVPPERQKIIRQSRVAEGMLPDEVRMAWGAPEKIEDLTTAAEREQGHLREQWSFDTRADRQGVIAYQRQACFLDNKLLWFKDLREQPAFWTRFQ